MPTVVGVGVAVCCAYPKLTVVSLCDAFPLCPIENCVASTTPKLHSVHL